ncbi:hypothetical protein [Acidianus sp. HS-5]|nr:hypothetical protein [Acidianus sp. HS-5]
MTAIVLLILAGVFYNNERLSTTLGDFAYYELILGIIIILISEKLGKN